MQCHLAVTSLVKWHSIERLVTPSCKAICLVLFPSSNNEITCDSRLVHICNRVTNLFSSILSILLCARMQNRLQQKTIFLHNFGLPRKITQKEQIPCVVCFAAKSVERSLRMSRLFYRKPSLYSTKAYMVVPPSSSSGSRKRLLAAADGALPCFTSRPDVPASLPGKPRWVCPLSNVDWSCSRSAVNSADCIK